MISRSGRTTEAVKAMDLQLEQMTRRAKPLFGSVPSPVQEFAATHEFDDWVWLGQGPFYGWACEAALKVTESSCSYAQSFHRLEFRHGPKSIAGTRALVDCLVSDTGYSAEIDLLEEVKSLGSKRFVVSPNSEARVKAAADILLAVPAVGWSGRGSRLRFHGIKCRDCNTGLKKGLNPGAPRNLSQVVILEEIS